MADQQDGAHVGTRGHEHESRYRQYWEEMPCYLSVHDRDFRIIDGNRRLRTDFGESVGGLCYRVYKQREEVCPDCPVEATFADEKSHRSEQTLITRRGEAMPVMVHTKPIRNDDGEVAAVMVMHTDIREVKHLQELLHHSQKRLATLFEEVPCYIAVHGPDLVIQHANRAFREAFGSAVGDYCYRVYKHREEPCLVCPAQKTFAEGVAQEHEVVVVSASGEEME